MGPAALLGLCLLGLALHPWVHGVRAEPCRRGWMELGGHCYGYIGQGLPWRKAEAWCRAARGGGHLASLHSPAEQRALAAFIARRGGEEEEEEEGVWIGLYRLHQAWRWTDGTPLRYSAWERGDDRSRGSRCAALEDTAGFLAWEEDSCSERKRFVCKHPA